LSLNPLLISPCPELILTRMPGSSLSAAETVQTLRMGELKRMLRGYDFDEYTGRWVLRISGFGNVLINHNVTRRFGGISGALNAPDNWIASISEWNGEYWLFRIASPEYVDIPAGAVINTIREILPGITGFGRWEAERVWRYEGAEYGELTGFLGRGEHPQVGDIVYLIRISWGNDGFTAFRVFKAIGILRCENGLVVGFNAFKRIFHAKLNMPIEAKIRDIMNRIKNTITSIHIDPNILDALAKTPVSPEAIERLSKRFPDFPRLFNEYRAQYGDTLLTILQALGYIATHGSQRNSERAVSTMSRLVSLN